MIMDPLDNAEILAKLIDENAKTIRYNVISNRKNISEENKGIFNFLKVIIEAGEILYTDQQLNDDYALDRLMKRTQSLIHANEKKLSYETIAERCILVDDVYQEFISHSPYKIETNITF
ncbi:hypothetical protein [Lapidilactobacillus gannanensis]|uniref:Uncharacterized protein n=2 Tax=Lapidilactobacillus gannanensis TaxID=2486002 RepID=A0ABW4BLY3_9LACO